ncbi:NAD(+) kinase [Candidatus Venteria ishoeyi]|uniref:NAD(+) kinase n=1 Tax=Candidatus Venteria ishoeyi TaxID=1899563 RepID=UPI0025A659FD|nr:NAD(+) kinase [Candidatus Venteria ishoeyi]MDM8545525.1 NAD(+) kinase [Candidatus Venteria ishoeyi]
MFQNIGLIAKRHSKEASHTLRKVIAYLKHHNKHTMLHQNSLEALPDSEIPVVDSIELGKRSDLIIVIGGDGTLLHAARMLTSYKARLLGINLGRLGFLTDIHPKQLSACLDLVFEGRFSQEKRFLLDTQVYRKDKHLGTCRALNDVVIQRWNNAHMLSFTVSIDGKLLGGQRSDGILIATPTGSTAYNLSGGGPVLHPSVDALLLLSMFPHTLSNPPIVVQGDSEIEIQVCANQSVEAQLTCDAVPSQSLFPGDRVVVRKKRHIYLIHPDSYDYFSTLRDKLHWGREP